MVEMGLKTFSIKFYHSESFILVHFFMRYLNSVDHANHMRDDLLLYQLRLLIIRRLHKL